MTITTNDPAQMTLPMLRAEWARMHGAPPPVDLGRDLMARGISYKRQEKEQRVPPALRRELTRLAGQLDRSGDLNIERQATIKPGTRLVREWKGRTCVVTVVKDGFLFDGECYASLTKIACAITGVNWSGPRFFGLRQRSSAKEA